MAAPKKAGTRDVDAKYELFLMRHGIAADRDPGGGDDSKRPLTSEGKLKLRATATALESLGVRWDWIVTSPLTRAVETAAAVADEVHANAPHDVCDALAPESGSMQKVIAFLAQHPERSRVLLVGHEPSLASLAAELIGAGHGARLAFKKGGCCLISFPAFPSSASQGILKWWLTPRLLRKMGS